MLVVVVGVVAARVWWGGERRVHGIDGGLLRWGLRPLSQLGKLAGMDQGGYSPGPLEGSWGRPFTHWTLAWSSKTGGHAHMRAHELVTHREGSAWIRGDLESDGVVINRDL